MDSRRPLRGFLTHHVGPILPNGREDDLRHPILEGAGLGLVGAHDELVEAGLGEEDHGAPRRKAKRGSTTQAHLVVIEVDEVGPGASEREDASHVGRHEPRGTVDGDDADGSGVEGEGG